MNIYHERNMKKENLLDLLEITLYNIIFTSCFKFHKNKYYLFQQYSIARIKNFIHLPLSMYPLCMLCRNVSRQQIYTYFGVGGTLASNWASKTGQSILSRKSLRSKNLFSSAREGEVVHNTTAVTQLASLYSFLIVCL